MVTPAPQLEDLSKATIALVTEDGVVLRGNPEKLESAWASKWVKLLKMLDTRGVILTWVGEGHSGVDAMMLCQKCESAGIKTVMLNSEMALTPDDPGFMYDMGRDSWGPELCARRTEVTMATVEAYLHNLYRVQPNFVYSVSRDFARSCQTPMLVMPDDTPAHSYEAAMDVAELAPKAEVTVYPWKEEKDLLAKTITQVRDFLLAHQPATTAR